MSNRPPSDTDVDHDQSAEQDSGSYEDQLSFATEDFDAEDFEQRDRERDLDSLADFANADTDAAGSGDVPSDSLDVYEDDIEDSYYEHDQADDYDLSDLPDDAEEVVADSAAVVEEAVAPARAVAYQNTPEPPPGEDSYTPPVPAAAGMPWGLISAAALAVILVAIGAYGVVKDRVSLKEEVRELSSRLAVAPDAQQFQSTQEALAVMEQRNVDLRNSVRALRENNATLTVEYEALQKKYERLVATGVTADTDTETAKAPVKQQADAKSTKPDATASTGAAKPLATPKPPVSKTPAKPPVSKVEPTVVKGGWFVNFGAYRDRAVASRWAKQLSSDSRQTTVSPVDTANGTLYRVRIINQPSRAAAEVIARELEKAHGLERLWVGAQ